jgi:hypothetical protein
MDIKKAGEVQFATSESIELTPFQRVLKGMLLACPKPIKAFSLNALVYLLESRYGWFIGMPYHGFTVFRLPCNVALKQFGNYNPAGQNETRALCLANFIKGVCSPRIIDFIPLLESLLPSDRLDRGRQILRRLGRANDGRQGPSRERPTLTNHCYAAADAEGRPYYQQRSWWSGH